MFNVFKKTRQTLGQTREAWAGKITGIFDRPEFDDELWEDLEEVLIAADVGVETSLKLVERTKARVREGKIKEAAEAKRILEDEMMAVLKSPSEEEFAFKAGQPAALLMVGINGTGKTTSIAKLAYDLKGEDKQVILVAGDTFRAAAIDQLKYWGDRLGVEVIAGQPGGDPGAVVFDALEAARKRGADFVIVDTAGRIQTRSNLMEELKKIRRIVERAEIEPQVLLVLDANTGQNGLSQARYFTEAVHVDAVILAKLDSTSKGGVVLGIADQLQIPIAFFGTGQEPEDLSVFRPDDFVKALLE
ncbi:MAG: signal recognition particle-docking protein FtsY [Dehalococcoidia bacterium]